MTEREKGPQTGPPRAGPGKGNEKCKADDVCEFVAKIAPSKPARPIPGPGVPFPGPNQPPAQWMEGVYKDIIDLWEAVSRLERINHYGQNSQQTGGSVIWHPAGGGGGPGQNVGTPPPPSFPL